jgi:hypothetical protein
MIYSPEFWSQGRVSRQDQDAFRVGGFCCARCGCKCGRAHCRSCSGSRRIGEPLYQCQPPTGYSIKADAWVNTGALLNRLNYTLTLASNHVRAATVDTTTLLAETETGGANGSPSSGQMGNDPAAVLNRAITVLLSTRSQIGDAPDAREAVGRSADFASEPGRSGEAINRGMWRGWCWARRSFSGGEVLGMETRRSQIPDP